MSVGNVFCFIINEPQGINYTNNHFTVLKYHAVYEPDVSLLCIKLAFVSLRP